MARRRYAVEEPPLPCARREDGGPSGTRGTRCYAEHSRARKTCRLLVGEPHLRLPPSLHVWGVSPPFRGPNALPLVCNASNFLGSEMRFDTRPSSPSSSTSPSPPPPASVLVLGPYADSETSEAVVKCVLREDLEHSGVDVANVFLTTDLDVAVPTGAMMLEAHEELVRAGVRTCPSLEREGKRQDAFLQDRIRLVQRTGPDLVKKARLLARLFFQLGMYQFRWGGPGLPYPIREEHTKTPVGSASNPISDSLRGRMVVATASGIRLVTRGEHPPADAVNEDNRLGNMEYALLQSIGDVVATLSPAQVEIVRNAFRAGTSSRMIDGSGYWSSSESLLDVCLGSHSVASGRRCVRLATKQILTGVHTTLSVLYRTPPAWSRYEGHMDPFIDPTDPSDRVDGGENALDPIVLD